jgi:hypothetical protein
MQNEMDDNSNIIEISDPFAVTRHLNYLSRIGLHCFVSAPEGKEISGRFASISDNKIVINLLASIEGEPEKMTAVDVKYRLDNILHSFKSWFLDRLEDNLFLSLPDAVLRYQIRRFDRVKVPEDRDLEVKFNLMPQKTLVKDISLGGMGIQTDSVPESFDRDIRLNSIKFMLKKNQTLHLSGILRYIRSIDDNDKQHYRIGVEFDPLKEDDKSTLLDLLDDLET